MYLSTHFTTISARSMGRGVSFLACFSCGFDGFSSDWGNISPKTLRYSHEIAIYALAKPDFALSGSFSNILASFSANLDMEGNIPQL